MEPKIKVFFNKMKDERLSTVERARIEEALKAYIGGAVPTYKKFRFLLFSFHMSRQFVYASVLFICTVAGGVSFAAEYALPGNVLYGMKVYVNEPIFETFAFSARAKAEVEADIAERRLSEVVLLSGGGELDDTLKEKLLKEAAIRAQNFEKKIEFLDQTVSPEEALEVTSRLEASLRAGEKLASLRKPPIAANATATFMTLEDVASTSVQSAPVPEVSGSFRQSVENVSRLRERAEEKIRTTVKKPQKEVVEKHVKTAEKEYAKAKNLLEKKRKGISDAAVQTAEEALNEAKKILEKGNAEARLGDRETLPSLIEAERKARSIQIILKATPQREDSDSRTNKRNTKDNDRTRDRDDDDSQKEDGD